MVKSYDKLENGCIPVHCGARLVINVMTVTRVTADNVQSSL